MKLFDMVEGLMGRMMGRSHTTLGASARAALARAAPYGAARRRAPSPTLALAPPAAGDAEAQRRRARSDRLLAHGVVALAAKLAQADGRISAAETEAMRALFRFEEDDLDALAETFDRSRLSADGHERHALSIKAILRDNEKALARILRALFQIARADGALDRSEEAILRATARAFGFDEAAYRSMRADAAPPEAGSKPKRRRPPAPADPPHLRLGVAPNASAREIKAAFKRLALLHHPDRHAGGGEPADHARFAAISEAYAAMMRRRDALARGEKV